MVEHDTPPLIDGSSASAETLSLMYPFGCVKTADLFGRDSILREYVRLKQEQKGIDTRICEIENTIKADMGESESGNCGPFRISWKSQTRRTFQPKAFLKDHPGIDLTPYYKSTNVRPFKVTALEKEAV